MSAGPALRRLVRLPWRGRDRIAREVEDEFQFHLEMRVAELRARGVAPDDARRLAMRRFGNLDDAREYCQDMDERFDREQHRRDLVADLWYDVRHAARQMARSPGVTLIAAVTLALGIGATTAIFSVVERLLINPIPVPGGERIVALSRTNKEGNLFVSPTPALVEAWRARVRSLEVVASVGWREVSLAGREEPEVFKAGEVPTSIFPLLAVRPAAGRPFLPEETKAGGPAVAMLGYGLWQRRFGGGRDAIGQTIRVDGKPHTIVGVMPRDFRVPFIGDDVGQLWLPYVPRPDAWGAQAIGKMREGATRAQLDAELSAVMAAMAKDEPQYRQWRGAAQRPQDFLGNTTRDTLLVLLGAVALVLLIACANVANVLLARASSRQREFVIRAALGAGRGRLVRQLLTESAMLGLVGGLAGALVAWRGLALIVAMRPAQLGQLDAVRLQPGILALSLGVAILTGVLFGLAPAFFAARRQLGEALKSTSRTTSEHGGARRFRSGLIVLEVSLSVVLLVGAGLLVRTLFELQRAPVGFDPNGVTTASIVLPAERYATPPARVAVLEQLARRARGLPGVGEVALASEDPLTMGITFGDLEVEGQTIPAGEKVNMMAMNMVDTDFFRVLRLPLRAGSGFTADSAGQPVVVNEAMARRYWPGTSAIGRRIRVGSKGQWSTVVGVVADVSVPRTGGAGGHGGPWNLQVYYRFLPSFEQATLILRTSGAAADLPRALARAAAEIDPLIKVRDVIDAPAQLYKEMARPRFNMALLAAFAVIAVVLAAVGLYGVIAYSVSQRTREMGIRLALGARPSSVMRLVLAQGARLTIAGVAVGLVIAFGATRALRSLLYGVRPDDPFTFAGVGVLLAGIALLASYVPARRATRVDPAVTLREE